MKGLLGILLGFVVSACSAAPAAEGSSAMIATAANNEGGAPTDATAASLSTGAPTATAAVACKTLDLGSTQDVACVLQAVAGQMHGDPCNTLGNNVLPGSSCTDADPIGTAVFLYADQGRWLLYASGQSHGTDWSSSFSCDSNLAATAACLPWSALKLSQPASLLRVDAEALLVQRTTRAPLGPGACVLSSLGGELTSEATVSAGLGGSSDLVVVGPPPPTLNSDLGGAVSASATCFAGVTAVDVPATGGALPAGALCGFAQVGDMASATSSVSAAGSQLSVNSASAVARCLIPSQ